MSTDTTDGLQRWLALEHEAVWLYGGIGARLDDLADAARSSFDDHRATRDQLLQQLAAAGVEPVPPRLTYGEGLLDDPEKARAAARDLEGRIAAACIALVGRSGPDGREVAVDGLRRAALAALDWDADVRAFPGLTDRPRSS